MRHVLPVRKAFLIAALVYVCNFVLSTAVALALNLSADPALGSASDTWFLSGTPLSAPGVFMIVFVICLVLATQQRWIGIVGIVGVVLLALISGIASVADSGMIVNVIEHHLTILTAFTLMILFISIPAIIILGSMTLMTQFRVRRSTQVT